MIYDKDDWEFTAHQKRRMLGPIQIDEMAEYETRAKSSYSADIAYDFQYWEEMNDRDKSLYKQKIKFRYLSDQIREARRTVATFPKRKYINQQSKNYQIELAKYNRALKLIEQYEEKEE